MNKLEKLSVSSFAGKTVVITGASSGVGLATAEAFARAGCNVVLAALGQQALEDAVAMCQQFGVAAVGRSTDVAEVGEIRELVRVALNLTKGKINAQQAMSRNLKI